MSIALKKYLCQNVDYIKSKTVDECDVIKCYLGLLYCVLWVEAIQTQYCC